MFRAFLKLGLTSFGGPIAHVGYFHREFVHRRGWLDDAQFAQLLAIAQILPGPASSQLGFAIGLQRAGWLGAIAAFVAFTMPSAILMFGFASLGPMLPAVGSAVLTHGLKLLAVVVVGHGAIGMTKTLAADWRRKGIALGSALIALLSATAWTQLLVIAIGGLAGWLCCRQSNLQPSVRFVLPLGRRGAAVCVTLFLVGLILSGVVLSGAPNHSAEPSVTGVFSVFYQSGALVFGGGHVVLPLLQERLVDTGWLGTDTFLTGYGAAQIVPGPMFSLAAYFGTHLSTSLPPIAGAVLALLALFLPGFLILSGVLPIWSDLLKHPAAVPVILGVNAAVLGLLAATLVNPVATTAITSPLDAIIVSTGLMLLLSNRLWVLWIALYCVAGGWLAVWVG